MGRNPITGFAHSNGHGRRSPGLPPVARQGNLVVEATQAASPYAELEKMLIEEVKKQKPAVRHDLHRHQRRLHEHLGVRAAGVQGQPGDGVPALPRRQARSSSAASTSAARRSSRCSRSARRAARSRRSTACAARRAAGCRSRRRRRACCIEKLEIEKGFIPPDRPPLLDAAVDPQGGAA